MHLFEIPDAIRNLLDDPEVLDPETGELLDEARLTELMVEKERTVLYLARLSVEQAAEAEAVLAQADRLRARADSHKKSAASLKRYIAGNCEKGEQYADDCVKVGVRESMFTEAADDATAPEEYMVQKPAPDPRPDKKAILDALKKGTGVKGWSIGRNRYAVIS